MYPNLYFLLKSWFGVDWPAARLVNMFGFFVAVAFIGAAFVLSRELKRKEAAGLLSPTEEMIVVGKPATMTELIINFLIGFLFGYKLVGFFVLGAAAYEDTQGYLLSTQGNLLGGLVLGAGFVYLKVAGTAQTGIAKTRRAQGSDLSPRQGRGYRDPCRHLWLPGRQSVPRPGKLG